MLSGAALIFGFVMMLLILAFRRRGGEMDGDAPRERLWIVQLGIIFPVVVLLGLLAYGLVIGERLLPRESPDVVRVRAEGRLSQWTFTYDDLPGRTTPDILHIPTGRPVDVAITSADVIHSFWVPRLAGKLDAIPGHINVLRLEADQAGTYSGRSAEFSGPGYDHFSFAVVAHDAAEWDAFVRGESE